MTTDSTDEIPCVVCNDPARPDGRSDCYICGEFFHLRLTTTAEGPDCGDVWIDDEVMALQFACRNCLDERMHQESMLDSTSQPPEPPALEPRRVRKAAPGASARDLARRRRR